MKNSCFLSLGLQLASRSPVGSCVRACPQAPQKHNVARSELRTKIGRHAKVSRFVRATRANPLPTNQQKFARCGCTGEQRLCPHCKRFGIRCASNDKSPSAPLSAHRKEQLSRRYGFGGQARAPSERRGGRLSHALLASSLKEGRAKPVGQPTNRKVIRRRAVCYREPGRKARRAPDANTRPAADPPPDRRKITTLSLDSGRATGSRLRGFDFQARSSNRFALPSSSSLAS